MLIIISGSGLQWLGKPMSLPQTGRDLMMAIDLSGSMAIEDMKKLTENQNQDLIL